MEKQIGIPEFKTLEEMAKFWDNHDLTDFENEMEEVKEPIFKLVSGKVISVMLKPKEYNELKKIADQKKLNTATLVNRWVTKHIHEESPSC
ncbi:MAG: hypothetical protein SRB1_00589 [Desulfobacteraceae bacterium Eth-SRB1]|nr:MAG: hypothetical protein SRB1_00589 [Desulfobacteraceae bacterium Eth-SRB1]